MVRSSWRQKAAAAGAVAVVLLLVVAAVLAVTRERPLDRAAAAPAASASRPTPAPLVEQRGAVAFIGDSWTYGSGASGDRGYALLTAEELGWKAFVLGVRGSGYAQGGAYAFGGRIEAAAAMDADVIVVQGSLNERNTAEGMLAPAVLEALTRLRAAVDPGTTVLVVGASHTPGTAAETIRSINATIAAAAESVGLDFVDAAAENWTDPADPAVWADPDHPNDLGHRIMAERLAQRLRSLTGG